MDEAAVFLASSAGLVRWDAVQAHLELSVAVVLLALLCVARNPSSVFPCLLMVSLARSDSLLMWSAVGCGAVFHLRDTALWMVAPALALLLPSGCAAPLACYWLCLEATCRAPLLGDSFASPGERHMVACLLAALLAHVHRWPNADLSLAAVPVLGVLGLGMVLSLARGRLTGARFVVAGCVAAALSFAFARVHAGHFLIEWAAARLWEHRDVAVSSALVLGVGLAAIVAVTAAGVAKSGARFGFAQRKLFHALIVAIYAQAIARHLVREWQAALTLATMATLFLLLGVELVRVFSGPNAVARWLNTWYGRWIDERDGGMIATTHLQLLLGCAVPLYLARSSVLLAVCGVVVVGVGDSVAAAVGIAVGRLRWTARNRRTVEGSVAMALAMAAAFWALVPPPLDWYTLGRVCVSTALMEAFTHHTDNLLLPLFAVSLLM